MNTEKELRDLVLNIRTSVISSLRLSILMARIYRIREIGSSVIGKYTRGYLVRKDLHFVVSPKIKFLIKWTSPAISVSISGSFTDPPWEEKIPLKYSKHLEYFYTDYFLENPILGRHYFKFLVDDVWMHSDGISTSEDLSGNVNNYIIITREKRYVPRAHSTRNLVGASLSLSKPFNKTSLPRISSVESDILCAMKSLTNDEVCPDKIKLCFGSFLAGHPKTRIAPLDDSNTADACFIDPDLQIFGIADGVGEWETFGLNAGRFPKELLNNFVSEYIQNSDTIKKSNKDDMGNILKNLLESAFKKTKSYGSSTVLLALTKDNYIYSLCIGDSGYLVFRLKDNKLFEIFRSVEQQHTFNCPYQLACFPDASEYEVLVKKGFGSFVSLLKRSNLNIQDDPQDAHVEVLVLQPNDIIIAATDGLFDNLFDVDIQKITETFLGYNLRPDVFCQRLAKELVIKAVQKGWDPNYKSPFSKNAANFGQRYIGGKLDDTTVVVGLALNV
jgi:protein phosphatase PTC7